MTANIAGSIELYPVSHLMYSALIGSLRAIVWEADPETFQFRFVSNHAEELLGFPRDEWLDDPEFCRRHTHPHDVDAAQAFCRDSIDKGKNHELEFRMVARDGRVVWLRNIVTVERSDDGEVRLRGVMIDVTRQRETDAALRASQERLAHAQKAGRVGTFEWDLKTDNVHWTPELAALYGDPVLPTPAEIWFRRVHPADLVDATDGVQNAMDTGLLDVQYRVCWPDGSVRWLHARGQASHGLDGKPLRMLGVVVDITERKELELELQHAHKMEALGRFAGSIAHDFNNLLTIITSYSDVIVSASRAGEHAAELREIRRAAQRGAQLTRQLLAFSRRDPIEPQHLALDDEVADVSAMLHRLLGARIRLRVDLGCSDATVLIGPGHIQQIVMNLAVNARDAMPAGGDVCIETRCTELELTLRVSDTGHGMSEDVKAHVFEPFFTTKESGKGTGLGLSTVFGLVQQAKGRISVESRLGEGSVFEVRLPRSSVSDTR